MGLIRFRGYRISAGEGKGKLSKPIRDWRHQIDPILLDTIP